MSNAEIPVLAADVRSGDNEEMPDGDTPPTGGFRGVQLACLLVVVLALIVGTDVLVDRMRALGPIVWLAEGALLAVALLAIGGYVGAFVYRDRLIAAEDRTFAAEKRARRFHEAAMKGRALAAVLEADARIVEDMSDEARAICRRHAAIAEQLAMY